jgi:hypothetical protein
MTLKERLDFILTGKLPAVRGPLSDEQREKIMEIAHRLDAAKIEPSAQERKVQLEPGDFQTENRDLILIAQSWSVNERLWLQEAADSKHPQRIAQARELAARWAELRELGKQFYRQWQIEP